MNFRFIVTDRFTAFRASVKTRVKEIIVQGGSEMTSTNYYIIHKTGRRLKVSCIGFCHDDDLRKSMLKNVAKVEHGRPQDYRIETEQAVEHVSHGRRATAEDFKEFTL